MRDLKADWRKWTLGERVTATAMIIALSLAPALLTVAYQ
jgi:hypothetical protein